MIPDPLFLLFVPFEKQSCCSYLELVEVLKKERTSSDSCCTVEKNTQQI